MAPATARHPIQFQGSRIAVALLRLGGWRVRFDGVPAAQGVVIVYPHTSNWDFVVGILAKWAMGIPVRFWAKDTLFRPALFGAWLRGVGGVPVVRSSPQGLVDDTVRQLQEHAAGNRLFWLAVTPEGTRSLRPGWKSGFYRVAVQAGVPLGMASLDFGRREVRFTQFLQLAGDEARDMAAIAAHFADVRGCKPELASPIRLLEPRAPSATMDASATLREDTA